MVINRLRVSIGVQPHATICWIPGIARGPGCVHAIVRGHAWNAADQHRVFIRRVRAAALAERLAVAIDVDELRVATLSTEQRSYSPSAENAPKQAGLFVEERQVKHEALVKQEADVVELRSIHY